MWVKPGTFDNLVLGPPRGSDEQRVPFSRDLVLTGAGISHSACGALWGTRTLDVDKLSLRPRFQTNLSLQTWHPHMLL